MLPPQCTNGAAGQSSRITGQMVANPEPLNGYIVRVVVFRKIPLQGGQIIDADNTVCTLPKFAPV